MNRMTTAGMVWLLALAGVETAVAAGGGVPGLSSVPQWAIMVGLAVICPEDLNRALRSRIGGERGGEGES